MKIKIRYPSGILIGIALTLLITTLTHVDSKHPHWFILVLGTSIVIGVELEEIFSKSKG